MNEFFGKDFFIFGNDFNITRNNIRDRFTKISQSFLKDYRVNWLEN